MIKHDSLRKLDELFDRLLYPTSSQQTAEPLLDDSDLSMVASLMDEAAVPKLRGDVILYGLQELCRDLLVLLTGISRGLWWMLLWWQACFLHLLGCLITWHSNALQTGLTYWWLAGPKVAFCFGYTASDALPMLLLFCWCKLRQVDSVWNQMTVIHDAQVLMHGIP